MTLAAATLALAQDPAAAAGDVVVMHPFAVPTLPGATVGGAYLGALKNKGSKPDKLVKAATPVAASVEIHDMNVDATGVMRMREIDGIAVPPNQTVTMSPGKGMHLMLMGLRRPLKAGESFPMTLQFERGGKVDIDVVVEKSGAGAGAAGGHVH